MGKKVTLQIDTRYYDMELDSEFATYLEKSMSKDFNINGNNESKVILRAYVRKSYELYQQEQEVEKILKKLDKKEKL